MTAMSGGHRETPLKEVADLVMGQSPPGSTYNETGEGLPFFQGVRDFNYRHPTPRVYCSAPSRIAHAGDLLLSVRAPIGRINIADRDCAVGRGLAIIRAHRRSDHRYLEFLLRHAEPRWAALDGTGSVFGNATRKDIESLPLPWHAEEKDRALIAHILGTLDDKIELNRRMNATLEAMARALFQSWFVDFDPVRAKMEGRDTGLPKEIADLFPDRVVTSGDEAAPKGWPVHALADHFQATKGVSYVGSGLRDSGMPLHNLNSIHEGGGYKFEGVKFYAGKFDDRHRVRPGDVIVANTEQGHDRLLIGYAASIPRRHGIEGIASHHLFLVKPVVSTHLSSVFLEWLLNSPRMHGAVSGYANGTTVNMLPIDAVQRPRFVVPPETLVEIFDHVVSRSERRREQVESESGTLETVRDDLVPELVEGKMLVDVAGRVAGVVA